MGKSIFLPVHRFIVGDVTVQPMAEMRSNHFSSPFVKYDTVCIIFPIIIILLIVLCIQYIL